MEDVSGPDIAAVFQVLCHCKEVRNNMFSNCVYNKKLCIG